MNILTKQEAIDMFGSVPRLAEALNVSRQAIYAWPDNLDAYRKQRVIGAAVLSGRLKLKRRKASKKVN